jgi:hypothetical protein
MANNVLGYKRTKDSNRLISSDFAIVSLSGAGGSSGKQPLGLVQNANVAYGHQVLSRFEAGSSNLYWVTGQAQGVINIARAVSEGGFFNSLQPENAASGTMMTIDLSIKEPNFTGESVSIKGKKALHFKGGVIANLGATVATGSLDVSETVTINVAELML